jgi:hypothetical protein
MEQGKANFRNRSASDILAPNYFPTEGSKALLSPNCHAKGGTAAKWPLIETVFSALGHL